MRIKGKLSINGKAMNERGNEAKHEKKSVACIPSLIPTKNVFNLFSPKGTSQKYYSHGKQTWEWSGMRVLPSKMVKG